MTKEQILGNYYREHKDTESAIYEAMDHYKDQEVAKEREKAKKLVEALKMAIGALGACEMENTCNSIEKVLTEYEKL